MKLMSTTSFFTDGKTYYSLCPPPLTLELSCLPPLDKNPLIPLPPCMAESQCYMHVRSTELFILSLAEPDPYTGGEGLVTCYTRSCSGALYGAAPIRLQLHCVTIVMRLHNNCALSLNIACPLNDRQACAAQYKLNMTSRKVANFCIPAEQLRI